MSNTREKKFFVPHLATSNNNIKERWYVFWYEPVPGTDLRKRKKASGGINYAKTIEERLQKAEAFIKELQQNNFYYTGEVNRTPENTELHQCLQNRTLRKHASRFYNTHVRVFLKWLKDKPLKCSPDDAQAFINFLKDKGNCNTTVNHYRNTLKSLYAELLEMKKIKVNPFAKIKKLKESRESKKAYTPAQVQEIKEYLQQHDPELWLFCQFIYYCFIRPNELRQLKIKDIDFYNNLITVPGSISKNHKSQPVVIPDVFVKDVQHLAKLPEELHIFGKGNEPLGETNMSDRFRKIRNELGYSKKFTMYSFKHTGAMYFAKKTKDVKALQVQLRHHSLDMVNTYLQNMGAIDNQEVRNNFPAI